MQNNEEKEKIIRISRTDAKEYLKQFHYLETVPGGSQSFAVLLGNEVLAIVCVAIKNDEFAEMTRFMLIRNEKNMASRILAKFLKFLKGLGIRKMVTFADPNIGHTGGIYKASGGRCVSEGKEMIGFEVAGKIISGRNVSYALLGKEKLAKPIRLKGKLKFVFELN